MKVAEAEGLEADAHHWKQQRVTAALAAASPVALAGTFPAARSSASCALRAGISRALSEPPQSINTSAAPGTELHSW